MEQNKNITGNVNIHRQDIDIIKAISIIAVVLYHVYGDNCSTGYLGVDAFFVINGFFVIPGMYKAINNQNFGYFKFITKRVARMLPLLVIACIAVLLVALVGMVPDDLLTVAESAVASLFFSNNLLSLYLCADYWDWTNEFKPLMHTWYLGVLMEMYLIIPIVLMIAAKLSRMIKVDGRKGQKIALWSTVILSFAFFIICKRTELNFYLVFGRIYEFVAGGIVAIYIEKLKPKSGKVSFAIAFVIFVLVLFSGITEYSLDNKIAIVTVVVCTLVCLVAGSGFGVSDKKFVNCVAIVGKASFSIYLWHQILLAFYRYFYSCTIGVLFWVVYLIGLGLLTSLSFLFVEKKVRLDHFKKWIGWIGAFGALTLVCLFIWSRAGVLYSISELDVDSTKIDKRKNAHYVDRIYSYDVSFPEDTDKLKVLVIGNSFARDFANMILESDYSENVVLSYSFNEPKDEKRLQDSDIIFVYGHTDSLSDSFWDNVNSKEIVYGIGTKNFGECIGQYYIHRFSSDYYNQTGKIQSKIVEQQNELSAEWGKQYIDIIGLLQKEDGKIQVFTDGNKYISYDMHHLTKAGAIYLSEIIDISSLLESCDRH